jgi:cell shape-determining protein MreC
MNNNKTSNIYKENSKLKLEISACDKVLNETIDECCEYLLEVKKLREENERLKEIINENKNI